MGVSSTLPWLILLGGMAGGSPIGKPDELSKRSLFRPSPFMMNSGCAQIMVIYARGTGEVGPLGRVAAQPLYANLVALAGPGRVRIEGVPYSASVSGFLRGGDISGSHRMAEMVTRTAMRCPASTIVMSGFDQGAQLVHNAAVRLRPAVAARVSSVVLYGDPDYGLPIVNLPGKVQTFCSRGDLVCAHQKVVTPAHLTYGEYGRAAAAFIMTRARMTGTFNSVLGYNPALASPAYPGSLAAPYSPLSPLASGYGLGYPALMTEIDRERLFAKERELEHDRELDHEDLLSTSLIDKDRTLEREREIERMSVERQREIEREREMDRDRAIERESELVRANGLTARDFPYTGTATSELTSAALAGALVNPYRGTPYLGVGADPLAGAYGSAYASTALNPYGSSIDPLTGAPLNPYSSLGAYGTSLNPLSATSLGSFYGTSPAALAGYGTAGLAGMSAYPGVGAYGAAGVGAYGAAGVGAYGAASLGAYGAAGLGTYGGAVDPILGAGLGINMFNAKPNANATAAAPAFTASAGAGPPAAGITAGPFSASAGVFPTPYASFGLNANPSIDPILAADLAGANPAAAFATPVPGNEAAGVSPPVISGSSFTSAHDKFATSTSTAVTTLKTSTTSSGTTSSAHAKRTAPVKRDPQTFDSLGLLGSLGSLGTGAGGLGDMSGLLGGLDGDMTGLTGMGMAINEFPASLHQPNDVPHGGGMTTTDGLASSSGLESAGAPSMLEAAGGMGADTGSSLAAGDMSSMGGGIDTGSSFAAGDISSMGGGADTGSSLAAGGDMGSSGFGGSSFAAGDMGSMGGADTGSSFAAGDMGSMGGADTGSSFAAGDMGSMGDGANTGSSLAAGDMGSTGSSGMGTGSSLASAGGSSSESGLDSGLGASQFDVDDATTSGNIDTASSDSTDTASKKQKKWVSWFDFLPKKDAAQNIDGTGDAKVKTSSRINRRAQY